MATNGHKVALISTDPAHSLGDAFNQNFGGGKLCDVELYGNAEGSLSVLEIDPTKALDEFKEIVDRLISSPESSNDNSDMKKTLKELGTIFDTLPAGTDEVVALAKVIGLVNRGDFDRIVLDTGKP
jgi:arsenite-transporting ATPase